jgi:hypothetical protein
MRKNAAAAATCIDNGRLEHSAVKHLRVACDEGERQSPSGLALTGKRLKLAILLAVLPTFVGIAGVIAFGIGVAIYGF